MAARVLRGNKQEIAERLVQISGEVREAIIFVEEATPAASSGRPPEVEDIFAEMRPFMVDVQDVDDSRAAIYARLVGE